MILSVSHNFTTHAHAHTQCIWMANDHKSEQNEVESEKKALAKLVNCIEHKISGNIPIANVCVCYSAIRFRRHICMLCNISLKSFGWLI